MSLQYSTNTWRIKIQCLVLYARWSRMHITWPKDTSNLGKVNDYTVIAEIMTDYPWKNIANFIVFRNLLAFQRMIFSVFVYHYPCCYLVFDGETGMRREDAWELQKIKLLPKESTTCLMCLIGFLSKPLSASFYRTIMLNAIFKMKCLWKIGKIILPHRVTFILIRRDLFVQQGNEILFAN